jgi:hypothetical protein
MALRAYSLGTTLANGGVLVLSGDSMVWSKNGYRIRPPDRDRVAVQSNHDVESTQGTSRSTAQLGVDQARLADWVRRSKQAARLGRAQPAMPALRQPPERLRSRRPTGATRPAWTGRVNTVTARTDRVDVEALLIRPDGCVAWALPTGQDLDATALVRALGTWFGQPA